MPRKLNAAPVDNRFVHLAWLATLVAMGMALLSLSAVTPARAATPATLSALPEQVEEEAHEEPEEEELEESECEEAVAEFNEGEISGEERDEICQTEKEEKAKAAAAGILPEECVVRTFLPTAVAIASHNQVRLAIYYTAYESTSATIGFDLGGSHLGTAKRQLGTQGVIHLAKHLSDSLSAKLQSAHTITVQVRVPGASSDCTHYFSSELTAHHASKKRITFAPRRKRS